MTMWTFRSYHSLRRGMQYFVFALYSFTLYLGGCGVVLDFLSNHPAMYTVLKHDDPKRVPGITY